MPESLINLALVVVNNGKILPFVIVIGVLLYFLNDALSYKVLSKQMTVYRDRMKPIIEDAKASYAFALQMQIHDGKVEINSTDFGNILARHSDLIDVCFLKAERYMRDRLLENHIPAPSSDACMNEKCMTCTDAKCRAWRDYAYGTFHSHIGVIWGEYRQRYSSKFFPLSIFEREEIFKKKTPKHYIEWCKMLAVLVKLSKNRWGLK